MNNIKTNVVEINGELFKSLLESAAGKSLKEISLENGFSDSFLRMVVKSGKASPSAQAVAKLYGIEPDAYIIKAVKPETDNKQLTIDDLITEDARGVLKEVIKKSILELFDKSRFCYDEKTHRLLIAIPYENMIITREDYKKLIREG